MIVIQNTCMDNLSHISSYSCMTFPWRSLCFLPVGPMQHLCRSCHSSFGGGGGGLGGGGGRGAMPIPGGIQEGGAASGGAVPRNQGEGMGVGVGRGVQHFFRVGLSLNPIPTLPTYLPISKPNGVIRVTAYLPCPPPGGMNCSIARFKGRLPTQLRSPFACCTSM